MASATRGDDPGDPVPGGQPVFDRGDPRVERFDTAGRNRHPQAFQMHDRTRPDARGNVQGDAPRVAIHRGAETRLSRAGRNVVGVAGEHGRAEIDCDVLGDCGPGNDRERQPPHRLGMSGPDDGRRRARHTERRLRPGCRAPGKNGQRQQDARPSLNRGHWCVLGRRHPAVRGGIPYRRVVVVPPPRGGIGRGCPCSGGVQPPIPHRRRSRPAGSPIETVRTV